MSPRAPRRRFQRAAKRRRRPDTLRLRASWGARHVELATAGALAIVAVLAAALVMALWLRFR
jgi:hypothetical protein